MDEEWKSIGKGAEICTNSAFTEENYGFFYEEFVLLNTGVKPKDSTVEVYKKENEEYSYILVQHFDQQHNLINEVIMRFKL